MPQLRFLRSALANIAGTTATDAAVTAQLAVCGRLLDHLIAQQTDAPLQAQCKAELMALLPEIERQGASVEAAKSLCANTNIQNPEQLFDCAGELVRQLAARNNSTTDGLCASIARIEGEYARGFAAAVDTQAAANDAPPSEAHNAKPFDDQALAEFIQWKFPEEASVAIAQSRFISGGHSKFTLSLTLSGAKQLPTEIILRGDAGATFGGASVVTEYHLYRALDAQGVCVPTPLALEESGSIFGSPFMLMAKESGTAGPDPYTLPEPNPQLSDDIAARLAAVHRVPLATVGDHIDNAKGRSSDKARAWLGEGYAAWKALNEPSPALEAAFAWLRRNGEFTDGTPPALVHGDFGLHNMLVHESRVGAILDWEFAHAGNPAYDLGYFYFQAQALSSWERFLDAYAKAGGSVPDERLLAYQILFAATRLGVMSLQAVAGFMSGENSSLTGAAIVGRNYRERAIERVAGALQRVL
jgi:aminoglycoside phosphotransferase (APT) family kinase protein